MENLNALSATDTLTEESPSNWSAAMENAAAEPAVETSDSMMADESSSEVTKEASLEMEESPVEVKDVNRKREIQENDEEFDITKRQRVVTAPPIKAAEEAPTKQEEEIKNEELKKEQLAAAELPKEEAGEEEAPKEGLGEPTAEESKEEMAEPPTVRRSGRERKAVRRSEFVSDDAEVDKAEIDENEDAKVVPVKACSIYNFIQGHGVALGSIYALTLNLENQKPSSAAMRKLFKALYKVPGRPQVRKDLLMQWSGVSDDTGEESLMSDLSKGCTVVDLREIGKKLLGIPTGLNGKDTKQAWLDVVVPALASPSEENIQIAAATKGKLVGYQQFCSEMRVQIQTANPEANNKDIIRLLGQKWREMSPEDKQPSGTKSSPGNRKKPTGRGRKGRKKKDVSSEEDEEIIEDEDDEEPEEDQEDPNIVPEDK